MPGDLTQYQWMVIPTYIGDSQLGGCCQDETTLTFQAQEMGTYHMMEMTCSNGAWSATFV